MNTTPAAATGAAPLVPASSPAPAGPPPTPAAQRLGGAGLLPFVAGALLVWLVDAEAHPYVTLGLSAYAALIISFLGGIHWGLAMRMPLTAPGVAAAPVPTAVLVWGVIPSLVAWPAVMMPPASALVIHALMLLACYAVDRRLYPRLGAAAWLNLRFRLSAVASLSCFIGAAGA
jgi:hypothetical protein